MKHLRYLSYILKHKYYVLVAGLRIGCPLWQLIIHDWTKFLPQEWGPYTNYFYADGSRIVFSYAWNRHQKANKHHWQYWVIIRDDSTLKALDMPDRYIKEMVADWAGTGRSLFKRWDIYDWYAANKATMTLSPVTREKVETLIEVWKQNA